MTTGGGFDQGEDFVSKRLAFDVSQESMSGLRELNNEMERFRVNAEAAARGGESFSGYIRTLGEVEERATMATTNLTAAVERLVSAQDRATGGQHSTAIPPGYTAPFDPASTGMGGGDRTPLPTTTPTTRDRWSDLAQNDPRAYLNARTAWNGNQPGDIPDASVSIAPDSVRDLAQHLGQADSEEAKHNPHVPHRSAPRGGRSGGKIGPTPAEAWRAKAENWAGRAGEIAGGLGPGGSFSTMFRGAGRALEGYGKGRSERASAPHMPGGGAAGEAAEGAEGAEGMGGMLRGLGGGLLKGAGPIGAVIGAVSAGLELEQKIGHQVQQYRNLGGIRGGGAGQGVGYEMQARMMALNPFISNEQSRQIIQGALTDGFTGKEFDTVTGFMAHNLQQMNMSVVDSNEMVMSALKNSGSSTTDIVSSLNSALNSLKEGAQSGYNTLPGREQSFKGSYEALVRSGYDPSVAAALANQGANEFKDMPGMGQSGGNILKASATNPMYQMLMMTQGGPGGGRLPGISPNALKDPARAGMEISKLGDDKAGAARWQVLHNIAKAAGADGKGGGNLTFFMAYCEKIGIQFDGPEDALKNMDKAFHAGDGSKEDPLVQDAEASKQTGDDQRKKQERGEFSQGGKGGVYGSDPGRTGYGDRVIHSGSSAGAIRDKVQDAYGSTAQVGGPDGWKPFDPADEKQMKDLASGKLHVRGRGETGPGQTIDQMAASGDRDSGGKNGVKGHLTIEVKPDQLKKLLKVPDYVPLTQNEQSANAGYGQSTKNNPPPGDTITVRGAR